MSKYVSKPTCGREGVGVAIHTSEGAAARGQGPHIFQKFAEIPSYDGKYPVLGAWVVGGQAAGDRDQRRDDAGHGQPLLFSTALDRLRLPRLLGACRIPLHVSSDGAGTVGGRASRVLLRILLDKQHQLHYLLERLFRNVYK